MSMEMKIFTKLLLTGKEIPILSFEVNHLAEEGCVLEYFGRDNSGICILEKLYAENKETLLGRYIEKFAGCEEGSVEYCALCEGVEASFDGKQGIEKMVIRELYSVKNFGKLSEKHFYFRDGVQVISGENEFGKTTLHAFVKAMLFGLERGRGRAAAKDDFTKYEPRSGGRYAGVMRFDCGGRHFRLERTFGTGVKNSKSAALICEDDGEELSVEHGDLEMLLGGLTAELFDSTVSVGQLKSRPGEALSDALENYAANYYETGGTELDLSGAVQILREKEKDRSVQLSARDAAFLNKLAKIMEEQLGNPELNVDQLVSYFSLSRTNFFHKLKSLTGMAPIMYIKEIRMRKAAELIKENQYTMAEIAYMVGFSDPHYFSKSFKSYWGMTSTEYAKNQIGR